METSILEKGVRCEGNCANQRKGLRLAGCHIAWEFIGDVGTRHPCLVGLFEQAEPPLNSFFLHYDWGLTLLAAGSGGPDGVESLLHFQESIATLLDRRLCLAKLCLRSSSPFWRLGTFSRSQQPLLLDPSGFSQGVLISFFFKL